MGGMTSILDRPIDTSEFDLAAVSRERLGSALDLDAPANATHRERLEFFEGLRDEGGGDLRDGEVLELIAGWARQVASATAAMLTWIQVLRDRPRMSAHTPHITSGEATTAELASRLGLSKRAATRLVNDAEMLTGSLWPVGQALQDGSIDSGKASIFTEVLAEQSIEACIGVVQAALPHAELTDHSTLRRLLHRLLVQIDPDGVAARHSSAVKRRRVNRVRPLPDGMASFSAVLPAPAATALDQACEAAARGARTSGDPRTLDQLRADALTTMAETALITGHIGLAEGTEEHFRFNPAHARVHITATQQAQQGQRDITLADALAWEIHTPTGTNASTGTEAGTSTGAGTGVGSEAPVSPYQEIQAPRTSRPGIDAPELVGYGAIPVEMVPRLSTQRWIITSTPPDLTDPPPPAPGYRPTAELDRYVRLRDQTCQAPGCAVPARRCDLDHTHPYPQGPTSADNLRALCRFHHRLKTHGAHTYRITTHGTLEWHTPTGQTLKREPTGLVQLDGWDHPIPGVRPEDLDPGPEHLANPTHDPSWNTTDPGSLNDHDHAEYQEQADTFARTLPPTTRPPPPRRPQRRHRPSRLSGVCQERPRGRD